MAKNIHILQYGRLSGGEANRPRVKNRLAQALIDLGNEIRDDMDVVEDRDFDKSADDGGVIVLHHMAGGARNKVFTVSVRIQKDVEDEDLSKDRRRP